MCLDSYFFISPCILSVSKDLPPKWITNLPTHCLHNYNLRQSHQHYSSSLLQSSPDWCPFFNVVSLKSPLFREVTLFFVKLRSNHVSFAQSLYGFPLWSEYNPNFSTWLTRHFIILPHWPFIFLHLALGMFNCSGLVLLRHLKFAAITSFVHLVFFFFSFVVIFALSLSLQLHYSYHSNLDANWTCS